MGFKPMTSDTSAVLCQLSYQTNWELVTLWVRNIPVECDYAHEYTRIIYLNCGETYENMIDHRSSEFKAWKKFRLERDSNPLFVIIF